jgi:NAD+ synthetase
MTDYKKFVENSRKWLAKYIENNRLQSIIIGISGGIDSTISCAIAYPVCKELGIPLIGRSLPTFTNKEDETNVANLVGDAFCNDYKEVNLEAIYKEFNNLLFAEESKLSNLQRGNIKARLRMIYLRHLASVHRGIVLDNDNFTEWNLGFWTVCGDSPMDVNLGLHYLWKTQIYELGKYLAEEYYNQNVGSKDSNQKGDAVLMSMRLTPTDGNGVSKSDCDQFGLENYEQVDDVLITMYYRSGFEQAFSSNGDQYSRLIDDYNEQGVDKVMALHQNTEFKRKPAPIMPTRKELEL